MKKVLILGAGGMLGHVLFKWLAGKPGYDVHATALADAGISGNLSPQLAARVQYGIDAENMDEVRQLISSMAPYAVINCIGLVKQAYIAKNPLVAINVNARFPHLLAQVCQNSGARLIHISSDGVFDGKKGMYTEKDAVSASDLYCMTKFLGEVNGPNCLNIRTSIIGHELLRKTGLVEWFLSQNEKVCGYTKSMYSGLPTVELAGIIGDYILPNNTLSGICHISSEPISRFDLLKLIADRYGKEIIIEPCDEPVSNRTLDSSLFRSLTGYKPPSWTELVDRMYREHGEYKEHFGKTSGGNRE